MGNSDCGLTGVRMEAAQLEGVTLHVVSWYPLAAPGQGVVRGEVMWLRAEEYVRVLAELDAYEGDEYARVVCMVHLLDGEDDEREVACWVYLGTAAEASCYPTALAAIGAPISGTCSERRTHT